MAKHRSHSITFKRQVAQEFIAGETLHGLAKRHGLSSFGIGASIALFGACALVGSVAAPFINLAQVVHGSQSISVTGPIPTSGSATVTTRISEIWVVAMPAASR